VNLTPRGQGRGTRRPRTRGPGAGLHRARTEEPARDSIVPVGHCSLWYHYALISCAGRRSPSRLLPVRRCKARPSLGGRSGGQSRGRRGRSRPRTRRQTRRTRRAPRRGRAVGRAGQIHGVVQAPAGALSVTSRQAIGPVHPNAPPGPPLRRLVPARHLVHARAGIPSGHRHSKGAPAPVDNFPRDRRRMTARPAS
jgi:hypothetical protein